MRNHSQMAEAGQGRLRDRQAPARILSGSGPLLLPARQLNHQALEEGARRQLTRPFETEVHFEQPVVELLDPAPAEVAELLFAALLCERWDADSVHGGGQRLALLVPPRYLGQP